MKPRVRVRMKPKTIPACCSDCKVPMVFSEASVRAKRWYCYPCEAARQRKSRKNRPGVYEGHRAYQAAHRATLKGKIQLRARHDVRTALERGVLRREACRVCGATKAHAHHDDYSKPLDVIWLCSHHHHQRHRAMKPSYGDLLSQGQPEPKEAA